MTWLPQFLVEAHGLDHRMATLAYSTPVAILILVGLATSRLIRRGVPVGPMLAGSMLLQAAVLWAVAWTDTSAYGPPSCLPSGLVTSTDRRRVGDTGVCTL